MTSARGVEILAAPCCGRQYTVPIYRSMNFRAWEHWTDGWRDGALLMPNDEGLRQCGCGRFWLQREMESVGTAAESTLPWLESVEPEQLEACIAQGGSPALEQAARLMLWRHLNHPYREAYLAHREAEDREHSAWETVQVIPEAPPDTRGWFSRLIGIQAPKAPPPYEVKRRRPGAPFTTPPFELSPAMQQNLEQLLRLMQAEENLHPYQRVFMAEVARQLGRFEEAAAAMPPEAPLMNETLWHLEGELIAEGNRGVMRYGG